MYQKILVPLDGSDLAECTLSHVESLVKDGAAGEVTLLNIVKFDVPWAVSFDPMLFDFSELRTTLFAASRKYLAKVSSRLRSKGIKVKTKILEADRPVRAIIGYAGKNGMELIIMTTHGHTGLKKMILGSVAFGVLHESHIPVFLIRPESCQL